MSLLTLLLPAAAHHERNRCVNCTVEYAAELTRGHCPVCGVPAEGHALDREASTDRFLVLAVVAMTANLLLLAWLSVLHLG